MALEDVGVAPPNEEARKMIFNPSEEMQTVFAELYYDSAYSFC